MDLTNITIGQFLVLGMTAVRFPPIARAWSQNFQWSMGVIRLDIIEHFATWFLKSTGGNPTSVLTSKAMTTIGIQKRTNSGTYDALNVENVNLSGIGRVSYLASIELSNFFLTCYIWFIVATIISALLICTIRNCFYILEKRGKPVTDKEKKFPWSLYQKGLLFQLVCSSNRFLTTNLMEISRSSCHLFHWSLPALLGCLEKIQQQSRQ
jgi:hypothetical protein